MRSTARERDRPRATACIKQRSYASPGNSLDAQLDLERDLQREAGLSEDYREGVTAFMEKRHPVQGQMNKQALAERTAEVM